MKKITMQSIADALNTSRVTVWKVLNNQPGVSEVLRNEVLRAASELGYKNIKNSAFMSSVQDTHQATQKVNTTTISVVVARPESSIFWLNIIHQIAKESSMHHINLMYNYLPSHASSSYALPSSLTNGSIQGMIILNVYDNDILSILNKLEIPKIFLDTTADFSFESLTGDLVLLEGKSTLFHITDHMIQKGKTDIGFIGDIHYAKTNMDRYEGFLNAMKSNHLSVDSKKCLTSSIGIETYKEEINNFLDNLSKLPEAFVCASDYVASFVLQYLSDNGYRVPEDILITGYDGSKEYSGIADFLTTVPVNIKTLGKRLVQQLLYRMNSKDHSPSVTYIYSNILWSKSTDS